jgi:hypothetical protein
MRAFIAVVLSLLATGAHAVMPPEVYRKARADAPLHVQVAILDVAAPDATPGMCLVSGEVVRVFRDTEGVISPGDKIEFPISCSRAGDRVPIGGVLWTDADALAAARFIEAYLAGGAPAFDVALYQSQIIAAPSETPQFPVD